MRNSLGIFVLMMLAYYVGHIIKEVGKRFSLHTHLPIWAREAAFVGWVAILAIPVAALFLYGGTMHDVV